MTETTSTTAVVETELPLTIKEKLASLEAALKAQNPSYFSALDFIHKQSLIHPEYVYMMSDEEMRIVVDGYERLTKLTIDVGKISKKQAALLDEDSV